LVSLEVVIKKCGEISTKDGGLTMRVKETVMKNVPYSSSRHFSSHVVPIGVDFC